MSGHAARIAPQAPILIDDLARPVPTEALAAAMAAAEAKPPILTEHAVLDAARQRTGLDDFGPEDFRERLRLLLDCTASDAGLTALGRASMAAHLTRLAANRLRVEDMLRRHPEIAEVALPQPIIIVGLPRSGTTHLHNFIAADTRLRSLPTWESLEPVADPDEVALGIDGREARADAGWESFMAMCPLMPLMHEMDAGQINEEIELQQIDFTSYSPDWRLRAPRWRDYYLSHDQTPHYLYLRKVLQLLTWQRGPSRWVLKCPQHMEQLGPLTTAFPDARLLITHRDPVAVLKSALTMTAYTDRLRRREIDLHAVGSYWTDRIERLLRACVRDRDGVPAGQAMDIRFADFMADEPGTLERAYAFAGLPVIDEARRQLDTYLADNRRGKHGKVHYDLAAFGLDAAALRERFRFYYDRFGVAPEMMA